MSLLYSTKPELASLSGILRNYVRLPFSDFSVPGTVLEGVLAHVRKASILRTYDFVDVVDKDKEIGWQVKSTMTNTPLTWMRAKIPNRSQLISASEKSPDGIQALGDTIVAYCNAHALHSMEKYKLQEIGYSRLIVHPDGEATYFERAICTRESPEVFNAKDFEWSWSVQKRTQKKEQLAVLHGFHRDTKARWFAWHGKGENQLHFTGERAWWPNVTNSDHGVTFRLPSPGERLTLEAFVNLLAARDNPLPTAD